jgi:hypothetical protein
VGIPDYIETTVRFASMRQIHAAIEHLHRGDFECAITLAGVAEGILPQTDKPYTFQKIKALEASLSSNEGEANRANDFINWLKHGTTTKDGKRFEKAMITELEMIVVVIRAISKFSAVYDDNSPQMTEFINWAIAHLQNDEKSKLGD